MEMHQKQGRNTDPNAPVIDSQSIKTSAVRGPEKGYDAGKKFGFANGTCCRECTYNVNKCNAEAV